MKSDLVLVTGVSGFIGSHVARRLLREGYRVVGVTRRAGDSSLVKSIRKSGGALVEGVFYDRVLLEKIFSEYGITAVVHVAAVRGVGAGTKEDYHRVNVAGTESLLKACLNRGTKKFIFCSSVGVYGTIPPECPASLHTDIHGDNAYHRSKVLAEAIVWEYVAKGIDAYIVRPTITYGEGDDGFPSKLVTVVRKRRLLVPRRDPRIHLLDVETLSEVFLALLKADEVPERVFLVADSHAIGLRELVDMISLYCHGTRYPTWMCLPNVVVSLLIAVLRVVRRSKWAVRLLLISRDWSYDISHTISVLDVTPAETLSSFQAYLTSGRMGRMHSAAAADHRRLMGK